MTSESDERGPLLMADGHDAVECGLCVNYALWAWPFVHVLDKVVEGQTLEERWLKRAVPGRARVGPWEQGSRLAENIAPDRLLLEHVLATRPDGMTACEWVEEIGAIDAPTFWDEAPEGTFWKDEEERKARRAAWLGEGPLVASAVQPPVKVPARLRYAPVDDDSADWEQAPTDYPHDEAACVVCTEWKLWRRTRWVKTGSRGTSGYSTSDVAEYRQYFPRRYEAMRSHHVRVKATARRAQSSGDGP